LNQTGKRKARILVVDDDPGLLRLLTIRLRAESYDVEAVESAAQALAASSRFRPDLVITDLRMDQMDGIGLLKELQNRWPGLKVIILTAHGTIPDAVQATQMGAFGFLTKPVDKQELLDQVQKALRISGFGASDEDWRAEIVTRSAAMEEKLAQAHMVAGTDARVLITGESGTGKELLARAIHRGSPRRNKPFVAINCSAMAENLLESELFGHEKGSFTGATRAHRGLFMAADGGTLMLDEIGDMPMRLQVKLLRVLQENVIRPVGSTDPIPVNVRVISATHRDLQQLMAAGQFRHGEAEADHPHCGFDQQHHPDLRRKRYRQGTDCPRHSQLELAARTHLRPPELRSGSLRPSRKRAIRTREGSLHWRAGTEARQD